MCRHNELSIASFCVDPVSAYGGTREQFARTDEWQRAGARYERQGSETRNNRSNLRRWVGSAVLEAKIHPSLKRSGRKG